MARLPRLVLPGQPHLLVLRGNAGRLIAQDDTDRETLLAALAGAASAERVALHAYAILDDCLYLLATPEGVGGLGRLVQGFGRRYVTAFNLRHRGQGTLWEGRYRCGVVQADLWLLPVLRFVEHAAVDARLVERPEDYPWSSARHHLGIRTDPLVTDHARFWALGNTPFEREASWREYLDHGVPAEQTSAILRACAHGWALGTPAFVAQLEKDTARPARPRAKGRPPKKDSVPN